MSSLISKLYQSFTSSFTNTQPAQNNTRIDRLAEPINFNDFVDEGSPSSPAILDNNSFLRIASHIDSLLKKFQSTEQGWNLANTQGWNISLACQINLAELKAVQIGLRIMPVDPEAASKEGFNFIQTCKKCSELLKEQFKINQTDCFSHIEKTFPFFYEKLCRTPDQILEKACLYDLLQVGTKIALKDSDVWYGLAARKFFLARKVEELAYHQSTKGLSLVATRLDSLSEEMMVEEGSSELTIGKLRYLSAGAIYALPAAQKTISCRLVSEEQLCALDFNKLTREQIDSAIESSGGKDTIQRRLELLSKNQLEEVFLVSSRLIIDQIPKSKYSLFPLKKAAQMETFSLIMSNSFVGTAGKERFSYLPIDDLNAVLNRLDKYYLGLISDEQLKNLNYSEIGINILLHVFANQQAETKLAYLSPKHFEQMLAGELNERIMNIIPEQIFHNFNEEKIEQLRKKKGWKPEYLSKLSPSQLRKLNLAGLNDAEIEFLFPSYRIENLYPNAKVEEKELNGCKVFRFKYIGQFNDYSVVTFTDVEVDRKLRHKKEICQKNLLLYSAESLKPLLKRRPDLSILQENL